MTEYFTTVSLFSVQRIIPITPCQIRWSKPLKVPLKCLPHRLPCLSHAAPVPQCVCRSANSLHHRNIDCGVSVLTGASQYVFNIINIIAHRNWLYMGTYPLLNTKILSIKVMLFQSLKKRKNGGWFNCRKIWCLAWNSFLHLMGGCQQKRIMTMII
jgi:hypothetical protein